MSYTFHIIHPGKDERTREMLQQMIELSKNHGAEVLGGDFDPDIEAILKVWQAGVYRFFAVTEGDKVVGYAVWTFGKSSFSRRETDALLTAAFVLKEHRGRDAFNLLFDESLRAMKYAGATRIGAQVDTGHKMASFFTAKGWTQSVLVFQEPR